MGAPATRQQLPVGLDRSPLGLPKALEDADGEQDVFDGLGFTGLFCVDPSDEIGIALEVEEIFRGDGRPNPPGEHSLVNLPVKRTIVSDLKFGPSWHLEKFQ